MGRSMRAFKKDKHPVRVGVTNKKRSISKASQLATYAAHGYVANPNVLGARDRTAHAVQSTSLQTHRKEGDEEFGSDDESDELRTALNKLRKDGKKAPLRRLTKMQRVHVGKLIDKHGDDYQAMSRDIKLNEMQHPAAVLRKMCSQYQRFENSAGRDSSVDEMVT